METIATFDVRGWLEKHQSVGEQVHVSQPREVACWTRTSTLDGGNVLHGDRSGMPSCEAYPSIPADLNEGYPSAYIKKPEGVHPGVEPVVEAISRSGTSWEDCDVCTFRNNLNKIGKTPIDAREPWELDACFTESTLFLDIREASEAASRRPFPDSDRFCYYGYKFEALCCGESRVDATSEYCAVMRIRIGGLRIMFGAEIDCCDVKGIFRPPGGRAKPQREYIEFKTHRLPQHPGQHKTLLRFKYPRWWLQSWLAGVPRMLVGGWDQGGVLRQMEVIATTDLPKLSARGGHAWDPWQCILFLHAVATWMQRLAKQHPRAMIRLVYRPSDGCIRASLVHGSDMCARVQAAQSIRHSSHNNDEGADACGDRTTATAGVRPPSASVPNSTIQQRVSVGSAGQDAHSSVMLDASLSDTNISNKRKQSDTNPGVNHDAGRKFSRA
mmetsp:Transcript_21324/g.46770  ORF Transcript_21324/g.46770 Transcript_21324/m.46770 type:complete len:441 (-) Transcript_21324:127-1449(-)|eukprot:CAMPEP_0118921392 /NCGR_PEP_ID=MMETSP1169-20130426/692_1 /TAXON_ID=36882 /ORGANISM="Pyramimonas obovata, Strain CCMP722" /LENGTH=440 /DNA_ID=CAMNT_0006862107 /DNA_START=181 /DNA_END=1503 /DNA_ORIENTATION=+